MYLKSDEELMDLPWRRGRPTTTIRVYDQDAELAGALKGDEFKELVTRQVHSLMGRIDELGADLIKDEDKRLEEEIGFENNKDLFDKFKLKQTNLNEL